MAHLVAPGSKEIRMSFPHDIMTYHADIIRIADFINAGPPL